MDFLEEKPIPVLQERGLFHKDYEGKTLREHLRVPDQYGLDPRVKRIIQHT